MNRPEAKPGMPWYLKLIIWAQIAPVLFFGYLFISCKMSEGKYKADRTRIEALEQDVVAAREQVVWQIFSLSDSERQWLLQGDPERVRLRTLSMCSLSAMEADRKWRDQYMEVCNVLGRADRALHDEERRQGYEPSPPSTDGF
ncbi:MAG: hypothetical protein ACK5XS_10110 [Armatimonadota bacterium]|jgi:hypothetical protein|nr:hypothetical protein [Fimbriimonadaceae bacterium]